MAITNYNNRISFDLPADYIFERCVDRKGQELVKIMTGEDGEGDYDFYCFVDLIEFDSKSPDSSKILEFAEVLDSSKLICISNSPKVYVKATRSSYSVFGNVYNTFELTGQVKIADGTVLELSNRSMDNDEGIIDEATAIQRFYNVLTYVCIDGKKLLLDMTSSSDLEAELKSNAEKEIKDVTPNIQVNISFGNDTETYNISSNVPENDSNTGMPFSEQEVLEKGPACGIWLLLGQITALCKNTSYFSDEDIEIIEEGLTTHEILISTILQRDPVLYEMALESKKVAASFILGVLAEDGKVAISIFNRAKSMQIPANFEKAFILISLFFDIPYSPTVAMSMERKREIMQDCRGFVNSIQIILSMEGFQYQLPDYCQPDKVSVQRSTKQTKPVSKSAPASKKRGTPKTTGKSKQGIDEQNNVSVKTSKEENKEQKEKEANRKRYGLYWAKHLDQYKELTAKKKKLEQLLAEIRESKEADREISVLQKEISEIPGKSELLAIDEKIKQLETELASLGFFKGKRKKALQAQISDLQAEKRSTQNRMDTEKRKLESKISGIKNEKQRKIDSLHKQIDDINYELNRKRSNIELVGKELFALLKREYKLVSWNGSEIVNDFYQRDEEKAKGCWSVTTEKDYRNTGVSIYARDTKSEISKITVDANADNEQSIGEVSKYILDAMNDQPVPIETFSKLFADGINKSIVIGDFDVSYKTGPKEVKTAFGFMTFDLSEVSIR